MCGNRQFKIKYIFHRDIISRIFQICGNQILLAIRRSPYSKVVMTFLPQAMIETSPRYFGCKLVKEIYAEKGWGGFTSNAVIDSKPSRVY